MTAGTDDERAALAAIDDAFAHHIGGLFEVLCKSIASEDLDEPLERFGKGLALARRARTLARSVVVETR